MAPGAAHFAALFEPRGIVVAGAASHPGKFGFVAYHNLRACGYAGELYGTNREAQPVLGDETWPSIADLPAEATVDLVMCCVPPAAVAGVMTEAAERGARAVFCASAGFAETDDAGRRAQDELAARADELDLLLAGPNGQGVISTPASMCAQIVAPMPPRGVIGIASQSGGFVSSFGNLARASGIGISRAISAGNCAQVDVVDYLTFFADDPATDVGLAYLEDVGEGAELDAVLVRLDAVARRMPVVLLRGARTDPVKRAARAHTGSHPGPAGDAAAVDEHLAAVGVSVVRSIHEAWRVAATFATQPLPTGPRVLIFGTAGGWGVVTADHVEAHGLELLPLPPALATEVDARVPPRWSRGNPVDLAGGETRETIVELLPILASHPDVDAVVYLGLGIQSNQAALARAGPFHPDFGLDRIVEFHERQDARYAAAAAEASATTDKPVLTATELAVTNPDNSGPAAVRASGRYCYAAGDEAVGALAHLRRYAQWRDAR